MNGQAKMKKELESVQNVIVAGGTNQEKPKTCTRCKKEKTYRDFGNQKQGKDGKTSICKECSRTYKKEWAKNNPDKCCAYSKKWRDADPAKSRAVSRKWKENNIEQVSEYQIKYTIENREIKRVKRRERYHADPEHERLMREKYKEKSTPTRKRWQKENPDKVADYKHRRRARENNVANEKMKVSEIYERDEWICQICLLPVDKELKAPNTMRKSLDHILPILRGGTHTKDNVQLAHLSCNQRANGKIKTPELLQLIRGIVLEKGIK